MSTKLQMLLRLLGVRKSFIQACIQDKAIGQKIDVLLTLEIVISPNLLMMREMFLRELRWKSGMFLTQ